MRRLPSVLAGTALAVMAAIHPGNAALISTNPTLSSGGNVFNNFGCNIVVSGFAGPSACDQIDATSTGGNLALQSDFIAVGGSDVDALLSYHVHSNAGVGNIGLDFLASFLGHGVTSVVEGVYSDASFTTLVARLTVNCLAGACDAASVSDPPFEAADIPLPSIFNDLWVRKDIQARGFVGGDLAETSFIDQRFSIPEPASLALLGAALAGFGLFWRRKQQTAA